MDESNSSEGILWQEDYHDSMNGDSYEQYFANSLCTNVPQRSLIVIDNAPYHSRNDETYPVSKWKKQQYIDWLKSKDIAVPKKMLRAELWTMCKQERDRYPAKIVESIAKNAGHETLRLPPHHCELNPIEMVWGVLNPITYGGGGFLARTIRLSTTTLKRLYLAPPNLVTFCFYLLDTLWQNFSKIDLPGGLLQLFLK